ncbi:DUF333 domain-containing protein [Herpetosiphon llansteffanensis]
MASVLIACGANRATPVPALDMANPASVFCTEHGGTLTIRQDAAGNQTGFCGFPDGSECEEWAFQRGECGPASQDQTSGDSVVKRLTMQDNKRKISLKKGDIIEIVLDSNPSTGYSWSVAPDAGNLLAQQGQAQYQASDPNPKPGSGGTETFSFEAVAVGSGSFALVYQRGFEAGEPDQMFLIELEISE